MLGAQHRAGLGTGPRTSSQASIAPRPSRATLTPAAMDAHETLTAAKALPTAPRWTSDGQTRLGKLIQVRRRARRRVRTAMRRALLLGELVATEARQVVCDDMPSHCHVSLSSSQTAGS